jgi:hypothetical protein
MNKDKSRKLKVHIVFGGILTVVLLVNVFSRLASGERLPQATWNALSDIRPVEWAMVLLFWYSSAFQKARDEWTTTRITTLGLSERP